MLTTIFILLFSLNWVHAVEIKPVNLKGSIIAPKDVRIEGDRVKFLISVACFGDKNNDFYFVKSDKQLMFLEKRDDLCQVVPHDAWLEYSFKELGLKKDDFMELVHVKSILPLTK